MNLLRDIPETDNATPNHSLSPDQNHDDSQHSRQSQATPLPPLHQPLPRLPATIRPKSCPRLTMQLSTTPRRAPMQTMIWNYVQPHLNQNTQTNEHPRNRMSQHSTDTSTQGDALINSTPHEHRLESRAPNTMHQCMLHVGYHQTERHPTPQEHQNPQPAMPTMTNEGWGDIFQFCNPQNHFQIISKNVSTLNPQSLDMVAIATKLQSMQASWPKKRTPHGHPPR